MVEALTEWEPGPETNGWIALNIMGWQYRKVKGGVYTWIMPDGHYDTRPPDYTGDVCADYEVLCRVRSWDEPQQLLFQRCLETVLHKRMSSQGVRVMWTRLLMLRFYQPGDYSHAAYLALTGEGQ